MGNSSTFLYGYLVFQVLPKVLFIERPKKDDSVDEDEDDKPPDSIITTPFQLPSDMNKYLGWVQLAWKKMPCT